MCVKVLLLPYSILPAMCFTWAAALGCNHNLSPRSVLAALLSLFVVLKSGVHLYKYIFRRRATSAATLSKFSRSFEVVFCLR